MSALPTSQTYSDMLCRLLCEDSTYVGSQLTCSQIPQDSALFSASLRDNIDPFHDYSDEECLDALRRVGLISESASASRRTSRAASILDGEEGVASEASSVTHVLEPSSDSTASKTLTLETMVRDYTFVFHIESADS